MVALEIVDPEVGRGLMVVDLEGLAGAVAAGLHAEHEDLAVGVEAAGLPRGLAGDVHFEWAEAGAVFVDEAGLAGGGKEEAAVGGCLWGAGGAAAK